MSLTLFNYAMLILMPAIGFYIILKNPRSVNSVLIFIFSISAALCSFFIGLGFDLGNAGMLTEAGLTTRLAGIASFIMYMSILRLSLSFPYEKPMWIFNIIWIIAYLAIAALILFTDFYTVGVAQKNGIYFRIEGIYYRYFSILSLAIVFATVVIFLVRRLRFESRIFKQQVMIMTIGLVISMIVGVIISVIVPSYFGIFHLYPLSGLMGFLMGGSLVYAIVTTRLFDISSTIHRTILYLSSVLVIGIIVGIVFALFHLTGIPADSPGFVIVVFAMFAGMIFLRQIIIEKLMTVFKRKSDYADDLVKALDGIDFSGGKEAVIAGLKKALSENIGTASLTIVSENSIGEMTPIFSNTGFADTLDKHDEFVRLIVNETLDVVFRSDIISNPKLTEIRTELMDLMFRMNCEALIFFQEGTALIGIIALGQKESSSEYDAYDYQALKLAISKLFVFMYYFRNVEKQTVAITVDKEIRLSEQIIASLLENIDPIESGKIDFHFKNISSKGLGGDFIDVVRRTDSQYVLLIGDIAGHGINASMSMIILKSVIRTFLQEASDLKTLIVKLNRFIKTQLPRGTFFAGVFFLLDSLSDTIEYINCGVPLIALYSTNYNSVIEIQGEGKVLGFVKDISALVSVKRIQMETGDTLLITTDGCVESESLTGEKFGKQRVTGHLTKHKEKKSKELVEKLWSELLDFSSGAIIDDITLAAIKINSTAKGG